MRLRFLRKQIFVDEHYFLNEKHNGNKLAIDGILPIFFIAALVLTSFRMEMGTEKQGAE